MSALESPKRISASALASKVLPTPVGPSNAKVPMGRRGSFKSARERRNALDKAETASFWPTSLAGHFRFQREQALGFVLFHPLKRDAGPPGDDLQNLLFADGDAFFLAPARQAAKTESNFSLACFSLSRMAAAPSKSWSLMARSFCALIASMSPPIP